MPLNTDPQLLLAIVAIINALAAGASQIIAAIGHIQRPRTVSTVDTFGVPVTAVPVKPMPVEPLAK